MVVRFLYLMFLSAIAYGTEVVSARISRHSSLVELGTVIDTRYQKDFAACFDGIDLDALEDAGELGVWGCPVRFILKTSDGYYSLTMNNTPGVFNLYPVKRLFFGVYVLPEVDDVLGKCLYMPELYDKLKAEGVYILSESDLSEIAKLPADKRRAILQDYAQHHYKEPQKTAG